jgi:hypothetical protein
MQLELRKGCRLIALCHNEAGNLDEDRGLATAANSLALQTSFPCRISFPFSVVPKV